MYYTVMTVVSGTSISSDVIEWVSLVVMLLSGCH